MNSHKEVLADIIKIVKKRKRVGSFGGEEQEQDDVRDILAYENIVDLLEENGLLDE